MSAYKRVGLLCLALTFAALVCLAAANSALPDEQTAAQEMGYETRLFDPTVVHTIDIVMDDWDAFLADCENEEYALCAVVIDGEAFRNVGIRAKGNTSLSNVSAMGSSRYSFKLEFDHYVSGKSCYGLDKLCLNNLIQDATFMKDYLVYQLMDDFGVNAPLCSYVFVTVNGEDWGLYLAVEGVEDAFLQRNYGQNPGNLYKPDSSDLGGGRGNGRGFDGWNMQDDGTSDLLSGLDDAGQRDFGEGGGQMRGGPFGQPFGPGEENAQGNTPPNERPGLGAGGQRPFGSGRAQGGFGGMGSSDVKLQYIDDDPDSYSNIFDNAKTALTQADKARLIRALRSLSAGEKLDEVLDIEQVLRYFVVHNFVCNGDSYTGSMVHNYYLYEEDGRLSMIPWDYNLAFGTFQGGDASSMVNFPIDTPVSGGELSDRPMLSWIFADEEYTALYHQYFAGFLAQTDFDGLIISTAELIAPYVERDPTKFYSFEEFERGTAALQAFCQLRAQSVEGQLAGSIPSTDEGQRRPGAALVDTSGLTLSEMGSMGGGRNGQPGAAGDESMGMPPGDMESGMGVPPGNMENGMENGMGVPPGGQEEYAAPNGQAGAFAAQTSPLLLLAVSAGALLAGLLFAFRFRR